MYKTVLIIVFIFTITYIIFITSPESQINDSGYSMVASQSIIENRTVWLDKYDIKFNTYKKLNVWTNKYDDMPEPYQLWNYSGHILYSYPAGTSILSVPFVKILNLYGLSAVNTDKTYNQTSDTKIQRIIASFLMSCLACIIYLIASEYLNAKWSVFIALTAAFGTSIFSTASRALWSHTWGAFLSGIVVLLMVKNEKSGKLNPYLLATLLSWMYFCRPTFSTTIMCISVFILLYYRSVFLKYALTGIFWFLLFLAYNKYAYNQFIHDYYTAALLSTDTYLEAFIGNLISPSRGVFVYSPFLFVALIVVTFNYKRLCSQRMLCLALIVFISHLAAISVAIMWYGGGCYGPRFMTDVIVWLILVAVIALNWILSSANSSIKSLIVITAIISVLLHGVGAYSRSANTTWHAGTGNSDSNYFKLWSWKNAQFLEPFK
jgi:hypothetical protein